MEHRELDKLKENVEDALKKIIAKGENISPSELDVATKAVCLIDKIRDYEMEGLGEYSEAMRGGNSRYSGYPVPPMPYPYDGYYADSSYRGRSNNRGMYRDGGYSGHDLKAKMLDVLDHMKYDTDNDRERKMVEDWIRVISSAK